MNQENLKKVFALILPNTRLNRSLRILVATNSILVFIIGLFAPFYAVFILELGGTIAFAGLSWAIFSIVAGLLIFLFSNLELKVKEPELLIAVGYIIRSVVFLSYAFMGNIAQLIATQILWGIGAALGTPAFDSVYATHTSQEDSIVQWGGWEGISSIAAGVAALVGGILIQSFGYPTVFVTMAIISFGLGIYIWALPRDLL
jgi:MFS family permease